MDNNDLPPKKRVTSLQDELKQRRARRGSAGQPPSSQPAAAATPRNNPNQGRLRPNKQLRSRKPPQGKILTYQPRQQPPAIRLPHQDTPRPSRTLQRTARKRTTSPAMQSIAGFIFSTQMVALVVLVALLGVGYVLFMRPNSYRIYVGDVHVVTIAQGLVSVDAFTQQVESLLEGQIGSRVYLLDTINFSPRNTRGEILTVDQALNQLVEQMHFLVEGATFVINGQAVATVASPAEAQSILWEIASRSLPSTASLIDVELRNGQLTTSFVAPASVDSRDTTLARLTVTSRETLVHVIQTGQFLSTLSGIYQLSLEEILALNPDMDVNTVLRVGDPVTVATDVPFLDLATIEEYQAFEDVTAPMEHRVNPSLPAGVTQVVQEGVPGQLRRTYTVTRQQGVEQERYLTNREYVIPPIPYIIEMSADTTVPAAEDN